jgi:hypothetical protein
MNEEIREAGRGVVEAAVELLQKARAKALAEQDQLVAQGDIKGAVENARAYANDLEAQTAKCRMTVTLSEQNKVGWFVNAITLGYNRRAQNALFSLMHEVLRLIEAEQKLATERVTELQSKQCSGSSAAK